MPIEISVSTDSRVAMVDITSMVQNEVTDAGVRDGICVVYVPHTTAGVIINEGADPAVCRDIMAKMDNMVPRDGSYRHMEGNADSHIKTAITGNSVTVPVEQGRLVLGTWQRIFFCEFDGPRSRKAYVVFA